MENILDDYEIVDMQEHFSKTTRQEPRASVLAKPKFTFKDSMPDKKFEDALDELSFHWNQIQKILNQVYEDKYSALTKE